MATSIFILIVILCAAVYDAKTGLTNVTTVVTVTPTPINAEVTTSLSVDIEKLILEMARFGCRNLLQLSGATDGKYSSDYLLKSMVGLAKALVKVACKEKEADQNTKPNNTETQNCPVYHITNESGGIIRIGREERNDEVIDEDDNN